MKSGKTINELAQHVSDMRDRAIDYRLPGSSLEMGTDLILRTRSTTTKQLAIAPNRLMHSQLAERLGIPSRYYAKMQQETPGLLASNVNEWLTRGNGEKRFVRTYQDGDGTTGPLIGRAFLGSTYRPLDNYDLMTALVPPLLGAGVEIASAEVTESKLYIQAVAKHFKSRVVYPGRHDRIDDILNIGLVASNSEVGGGALSIRALVFRQVCNNGLVVSTDLPGFKQVHIGRDSDEENAIYSAETKKLRDAATWAKANDAIKAALSQATLDKVTETINRTAGVNIPEPEKAIEIIGERYSLVEDERAQVMRNLISGGIGSTQWGLINAVTAIANECPNYDRAVELEEIGGKMLAAPASAFGVN